MSSLCFLDLKENTCWVDQAHGIGFPLMQMQESNEACKAGGDTCWFAITKKDLDRIQHSLNH